MPADIEGDREICTERYREWKQLLPSPGGIVLARGERWRLEAIVPHEDCAELRLVNATSGSRVLLSPFDVVKPINQQRTLRAVRARRWRAGLFRHISAPSTGQVRVSNARVRLLAYQLAPALAVAAGESVVLLADEVGLGKTIQAGWIVADVLARHHDVRILISMPAGLRQQWQTELADRFAIESVAADARWLRRTVADLPANVNPWSLPGVYLTSTDFIKRPGVVRALADQIWDLLVVDEVHASAAPTDRHSAIELLARRSRVVVTITATPFSGDIRSFESIARLGCVDDSTAPLMFRRSREEVGGLGERRHRFVTVRIAAAERRLHRLLDRYTHDVWKEAPADAAPVHLAMTILRKRALSSPYAVLRSLERRFDLLARIGRAPQQLDLFSDDDDSIDDDEPVAVLSAPGFADGDRERQSLTLLVDAARQAAVSDAKRRFLVRLLRRTCGEAAIVFTEYRDTLVHLSATFPQAALLHGGLTAAEREAVQHRFNNAGGILLATDAASAGLNLQERCRVVVNYELPWSPARLEQRIGRVDRIGQARPVHALTLVARDTAEELVIKKLILRLHRIAATLGDRDRMSAFLTEARIARIVIGGEPPPEAGAASPLKALFRTLGDENSAAGEARRLLIALNGHGQPEADSSEVRVSTLASTGDLPEGYLFVVLWIAATTDGERVSSEVTLIHISESIPTGRLTAAVARGVAAAALTRHEDRVRTAAARYLRPQMLRASCAHRSIVSRLSGRERALAALRDDMPPIQPGLFDHRTLERASEVAAASEARTEEHRRKLFSLERSLDLTDSLHIVGILLIGRKR